MYLLPVVVKYNGAVLMDNKCKPIYAGWNFVL